MLVTEFQIFKYKNPIANCKFKATACFHPFHVLQEAEIVLFMNLNLLYTQKYQWFCLRRSWTDLTATWVTLRLSQHARGTCQWLKFPLNGLRAPSRVSPAVGLLPLASGLACLGMAFPPFLVKQLHRCDSVVISSFVRTGYTTSKWGWLLGRVGYSIRHRYPLYP